MSETTTIAALATAPAPAGIAVIRISGPRTRLAIHALFRSEKDPVSDPRRLVFGTLIDHRSSEPIDNALAVFMPGPHSFTGEDVGEFQFHGSPLLVEKILRSLFSFGVTPAEPGEFSKRAFLNGKMDLVQAEAVADLISASSEQALKLAGEYLKGRFSNAIKEIGEPLRDALAEIEASIDFPEEDIEPKKLSRLSTEISDARDRIAKLLDTYSYGHKVKEGFRVLLCGRPNVGKSSILNVLLGRPRAIVSEVSGTTRDIIEEEASISGYRFIFCDSAGITHTTDTVEKMGVELARERLGWADLVLLIADATDTARTWEKLLDEIRGKSKKIWMITNKIDLNPSAIGTFFCDSRTCEQNFYISAKTGDGMESLNEALLDEVSHAGEAGVETSGILTNERHRSCLAKAHDSLGVIITGIQSGSMPLEIISAELRTALSSLEEIVGSTYTEDILGRIFSKFCVGK